MPRAPRAESRHLISILQGLFPPKNGYKKIGKRKVGIGMKSDLKKVMDTTTAGILNKSNRVRTIDAFSCVL